MSARNENGSEQSDKDPNNLSACTVDRRRFLKIAGTASIGGLAGAAGLPRLQDILARNNVSGHAASDPCPPDSSTSRTLGGTSTSPGSTSIDGYGPPQKNGWNIAFEDAFQGNSLDERKWGVGWGWGNNANYSPASMHADNVTVQNNTCVLSVTKDPLRTGGIHTKNKFTFGPGSYLEAKIKSLALPGSNTAFWSKPNSEKWPPEIDFMELPHKHINSSMHHIHWTTGAPGDADGHQDHNNGNYDIPNPREEYYVYGCRWLEDSVAHYVNGNLVGETSQNGIMQSLNAGAPFYLMISLSPGGKWGNLPQDFSNHKNTCEVDWVRVWEKS